ncbi:MAG: hypothetical protein WAU68_03785 [Vitreimonas sp.]
MNDDEMNDLRGGFAVGGIDINFGATVTTYVNGQPALTTQLTWTDAGQIVQQTVGDVGVTMQNLSPAALSALGLDGSAGSNGVAITDANGVTALVHTVTGGALQNIIINDASNRDIRQDIDVTLTLPGFDAIQNAIGLQQFGLRLGDDLRSVDFGG